MFSPKTDSMCEAFDRIALKLKQALGWSDQEVELWFKTRNKTLGGESPLKMIVRGRAPELESWIEELLPILSTDYREISSDLRELI